MDDFIDAGLLSVLPDGSEQDGRARIHTRTGHVTPSSDDLMSSAMECYVEYEGEFYLVSKDDDGLWTIDAEDFGEFRAAVHG